MEAKKVLKDVAETWISWKLMKASSRLFTPLAVAGVGVGYYLYKRYLANERVSTS